jgi:hypothetical protein
MEPTRRQIIGQRLVELIKEAGGNVVSPPGEHIKFEAVGSVAETLPRMLRDLRHHVNALGSVERMHPAAIVETITDTMPDGTKAKRTVTHAGLAQVAAFEVITPSDQQLAQAQMPVSTPRRWSRADEIGRRKAHRRVAR